VRVLRRQRAAKAIVSVPILDPSSASAHTNQKQMKQRTAHGATQIQTRNDAQPLAMCTCDLTRPLSPLQCCDTTHLDRVSDLRVGVGVPDRLAVVEHRKRDATWAQPALLDLADLVLRVAQDTACQPKSTKVRNEQHASARQQRGQEWGAGSS
jgi:hypothetical protein